MTPTERPYTPEACTYILEALTKADREGALVEAFNDFAAGAHDRGVMAGMAKGAEMGETRGFIQGNRQGFTTGYDEAREVWYRRGFLDGFTDRACYTEDAGEDRASRTGADWPPGPPRTDRGRSSHMLDKKTPHPHEGAY